MSKKESVAQIRAQHSRMNKSQLFEPIQVERIGTLLNEIDRLTGRWVQWNNTGSGEIPERDRWYWTRKVSRRSKQAFTDEECFFGEPDEVWSDGWHSSWIVLAYWSQPLPPPSEQKDCV